MNLRERFEKLHSVPDGIEWNGYEYRFKYSCNENEWAAIAYQSLWDGFQEGYTAGLEPAKKLRDAAAEGVAIECRRMIREAIETFDKEPK